MSSSLIKIDEEIVSSAVSSVSLGGSDWDTSFDVYVMQLNNVKPTTDSAYLQLRFLASSSADTSAKYTRAVKEFRADGSFTNSTQSDQTQFNFIQNGTGTSETHNGTYYLFNFNNASEFSFATFEEASFMHSEALRGRTGGGVLRVSQATNGVNWSYSSGNIDTSSRFTLYGLKKQ